MTLDERIAKRKAEGWDISHFVIKQDGETLDASGYFWPLSDAKGMDDGGCLPERYVTIDAAQCSLDELDVPNTARIVPVFTRTIKRPRTYSFWQACKMAMAGKKMRRVGDGSMRIALSICDLKWSNGESLAVSDTNINARWELAE